MPAVRSGSTNFATRGTAGTTGSARSLSLTMGREGSRCCPAIGIESHSRSIPFPTADGRPSRPARRRGRRERRPTIEGKDIAGAVVLTDAPLGRVWPEAVKKRGAAGVISTAIARVRPTSGTAHLTEEQKDVLQWDSIPFDPALRSFGFKCSWRAAARHARAPVGWAPSSCA